MSESNVLDVSLNAIASQVESAIDSFRRHLPGDVSRSRRISILRRCEIWVARTLVRNELVRAERVCRRASQEHQSTETTDDAGHLRSNENQRNEAFVYVPSAAEYGPFPANTMRYALRDLEKALWMFGYRRDKLTESDLNLERLLRRFGYLDAIEWIYLADQAVGMGYPSQTTADLVATVCAQLREMSIRGDSYRLRTALELLLLSRIVLPDDCRRTVAELVLDELPRTQPLLTDSKWSIAVTWASRLAPDNHNLRLAAAAVEAFSDWCDANDRFDQFVVELRVLHERSYFDTSLGSLKQKRAIRKLERLCRNLETARQRVQQTERLPWWNSNHYLRVDAITEYALLFCRAYNSCRADDVWALVSRLKDGGRSRYRAMAVCTLKCPELLADDRLVQEMIHAFVNDISRFHSELSNLIFGCEIDFVQDVVLKQSFLTGLSVRDLRQ